MGAYLHQIGSLKKFKIPIMRNLTKQYLLENGYDETLYKSVALYFKQNRYYAIPFEWKELLGQDVLDGIVPLSKRLAQLSISSAKFKKYCCQDEDFEQWLAQINQRAISRQAYLDENPESVEKLKETLRGLSFTKQQKHDLAVTSMTDEVRERMKKSLNSTLELRRDEILAKRAKTLLSKYGVSVSSRVPGAREKAEATNRERYGFRNPAMISPEEIVERLKAVGIIPLSVIESLKAGIDYEARCATCGREFVFHFTATRPTSCPFCNKKSTELERKIARYISRFTKVIPHHRILDGKEIDIYLPEKKIGFEINGSLTHNSGFTPFSDSPKSSNYHQLKSEKAKQQGIKLFHVWEHWEEEKIFNFINAVIGNCTKVYARNLIINESPDKEKVLKFLSENHIHGPRFYSFAITLEDKEGNIFQVMSFIQRRDELELSRLATRANIAVLGGAARIFSRVLLIAKRMKIKRISSFAYRDITPFPEDSVYSRLGFNFIKDTGPMLFFYVYKTLKLKDGSVLKSGVYSREKFMKFKIDKYSGTIVGDTEFVFDKTMTAEDNLAKLGIYSLYNSGCWKFTYNI